MYCERFGTTLTTDCCIKRQERARKQLDASLSFCESLIFCCKCPQGDNIHKLHSTTNRHLDLDVVKLKKTVIKSYFVVGDFSMFKLKRLKLKRRE